MGQPIGRARVDIELIDLSVLINTGLQGVAAVHGITERGPIGAAVLIGSLNEYARHFGGLLDDSVFPLICRRALERGGRLLIARAAHYTDVTDASTLEGAKATLNTSVAVGQFTIAGTSGTVAIGVAAAPFTLSGTIPFNTDIDQTALDVVNAIILEGTALNATIVSSLAGVVTIELTMPASYAAVAINGIVAGTMAFVETTPLALGAGMPFEADNIGAWGNGAFIIVTPAANGAVDEFDVTLGLDGFPNLEQLLQNQPKVMDANAVAVFNAQSNLINITAIGTLGTTSKTYLAGGVQIRANIADIDLIGDAVGGTGFHVFSQYNNFVRISVPEKAVPAIDIALAAYAEGRKDCRAILRTPIGISGNTGVDYREGQGVYSHAAINTFYASMVFAGVKYTHPVTGEEITITALGDYLGASTVKDNQAGMWYAVAGSKRGVLRNVLGVDYNLGTAGRAAEADLVDVRGINAVIEDENFGVVIWGNSTLYKQNTLLKHENVADLWVFINRGLAPLIKSELFEPNDIETWKAINRKVTPFFELLVRRRALHKYLIQGDQDIDDISQAQVNQPSNIDQGQYIMNIWIAPKVGLKYIGVRVIITNSGVNFEELAEQPTVV